MEDIQSIEICYVFIFNIVIIVDTIKICVAVFKEYLIEQCFFSLYSNKSEPKHVKALGDDFKLITFSLLNILRMQYKSNQIT